MENIELLKPLDSESGALIVNPVPLPKALNIQLLFACHADRLTFAKLEQLTRIGADSIEKLIDLGWGRLSAFLKLLIITKRRLELRTWNGELLLPLDDTVDPVKLCGALKTYKYALSDGHFWQKRPLTYNRQIMIEHAEPEATLRALESYLEHVRVTAKIVPASDGAGLL
jgi:hypothetical protein